MVRRKIANTQSITGTAKANTGNIPSRTPPPRELAINDRQPAKYPRVRLPQSPRNIEAGRLLYTKNPSRHPISKVDIHVTDEIPAKYPTTEIAKRPNKVIPEASPSNPSIRLIAFAIPTIHRQESAKPTHSGKVIDPRPKNWTVVNDKLAPQTTKRQLQILRII